MPELKNTLYIFLFNGRKRCTSCPKEGEGGRSNPGDARKKAFFFSGGVPKELLSSGGTPKEVLKKLKVRPDLLVRAFSRNFFDTFDITQAEAQKMIQEFSPERFKDIVHSLDKKVLHSFIL